MQISKCLFVVTVVTLKLEFLEKTTFYTSLYKNLDYCLQNNKIY